ncbi:acetyl-CoA C-acetyltransferase [Rhodococcus sp. 06-156-3C]|uniref:acetyl-CoA C-acetyltransferase n=1 Tax=Nocardiaceae TaxID=85025 RepID=UPI000522FC79|nr:MULTISPECIES: acetyl-CoA C-acetyltransferase [Rhodococcus]OZD13087.1 acetyl-CoA C-acetyltransferase [Rhodococcus sp. 06-156-4a]OZD17956.1 acetyl-CoA C-acetyltransferase [Rhodococcus sp. 06-156-3C]OZD20680.1 acetyl-CoA C-acetyltransferase [Rhodococcus sp. 06-156-4C]OZD30601.1 acetyl-CoA C-acetyltransferase [Rhodococcus sp. 06-156-3b]OZD32626.1 acetyl-CoA C-acetyltransferase [Rhodococcus sp. 06-156-3]
MSTTSVIIAGARTPIGKLQGGLAGLSGVELGAVAIEAALEKAGIAPDRVDYVIMGQVLTAGAGQMPARQAAAQAGIPMSVPALNINKVCLSGIESIILADQFIKSGAFDVVVAGGMESMSQAPHMLPGSRNGYKYGDVTLVDHMAFDGLHDAFTDQPMGLLTEIGNDRDVISREDQDAFAARSHRLAAAAWGNGVFDDEVVPVTVAGRRGTSTTVTRDEGIRADTTEASLAGLRGAFRTGGSVTAGNASSINDGACALIVMSKTLAEAQGLTWLAEIGEHGMVSGPDSGLQLQPSSAIEKACKKAGISTVDLDLVEINEAFAAVGIASTRAMGIDPAVVNVNGGAIALGHPIGMSGARVALHLALELRRRGGGTGAAALCGGGGQGDALILRVPSRSA